MVKLIERLYKEKEPLIKERNRIVDDPFSWIRPRLRLKLSKIDKELDVIESKIFQLREGFSYQDRELNSFISNIQSRLEKCIQETKRKTCS